MAITRRPNLIAVAVTMAGALASPTHAQAPTADNQIEELIVTARKRDETSLSVPVVLTAVSGETLAKRGVVSIDGLARLVPQLMSGEGTIQGGNITLRGIGAPEANPFADQAVSFNIDGVAIAKGNIRRMAEMDIQQIEVLLGPQALFFGKNSPAGIISIRSKDPGDHFEAGFTGGYESEAKEMREEGYISGPITDKIGARFAFYGSQLKGWVKSTVPPNSPYVQEHDRLPDNRQWGYRLTLTANPTEKLDIRFKYMDGRMDGAAYGSNVQYIDCPATGSGRVLFGDNGKCEADNRNPIGEFGPSFGLVDSRFGGGHQMMKQFQTVTSLEINYDIIDELTLTSVTGIYDVWFRNRFNATASYLPATMLPSFNRMQSDEFSQELRLTSSFQGPLNFMFGGHYSDTDTLAGSTTFRNALTPIFVNNYLLHQKGEAWSVFGQLRYDITSTVELTAGGRYSRERKELPWVAAHITQFSPVAPIVPSTYSYPPPIVNRCATQYDTSVNNTPYLPQPAALQQLIPLCSLDKNKWKDWSPEVTLTWRPSDTQTLFGSYKEGFISGGFNSGSAFFTRPLNYDQETVKGFEFGLKSLMFDGALRSNLALFSYKVDGLQVQVTTQGTFQELKNAGKVTSKGAEFDFTYLPPIEGLKFHGALAYNEGKYKEYFGQCYRGQTKAMGCHYIAIPNSDPVRVFDLNTLTPPNVNNTVGPGGTPVAGTLQDLGGTELRQAPDWAGNIGFDYERPLTDGLKIGFASDYTFSSSYLTDATSKEAGRNPHYYLIDASIRIGDVEDKWVLALIGRNLTNEFTITRNFDAPFSGAVPGLATAPQGLGDTGSTIGRGREILAQFSVKF
jgi:iron complex outermembrane recepter protein